MAGSAAYQRDRSNGNTLVDNGDPIFCGDFISCFYKILCIFCDFLINIFIYLIKIAVNAIQKADSHSDGTNVKVLLFDHLIGLIYFKHINHK